MINNLQNENRRREKLSESHIPVTNWLTHTPFKFSKTWEKNRCILKQMVDHTSIKVYIDHTQMCSPHFHFNHQSWWVYQNHFKIYSPIIWFQDFNILSSTLRVGAKCTRWVHFKRSARLSVAAQTSTFHCTEDQRWIKRGASTRKDRDMSCHLCRPKDAYLWGVCQWPFEKSKGYKTSEHICILQILLSLIMNFFNLFKT